METADEVADHTAASGRSYPLTKGLTGLNRTSASSPKADVRNVRVGTGLYGCLWPKADIRRACDGYAER